MTDLPTIPSPEITKVLVEALSQPARAVLALDRSAAPELLAAAGHRIKDLRVAVKAQTSTATKLRRLATEISQPWQKVNKLLESAEKHVRQVLAEQRRAQIDEQKQRLAVAAVSGASPAELTRAAETVTEAPEGVRFKVSPLKWRTVDFAALPDQFKTENRAAIDAAIKSGLVPPGIETYRETEAELRK